MKNRAIEPDTKNLTLPVGSSIQSGYIVKVLDTGISAGQPWLLMEYLEGETLEARVRRSGGLPTSEVAWIFAQIGHALGAAHRVGVLHMDLKPSNLFLAVTHELGDAERVKVLDFGIARIVEAGRTSNELTSQAGTLAWAAPEQWEPGTMVRPTIDVWPLGLIAFFALTGKEYWSTQNLPGANFSSRALLMEVQFKDLVSASARAAELEVASRLPAGFDGWFSKCVSRTAKTRWEDGGAAVDALLPLLGRTERAAASVTDVYTGRPSIPAGLDPALPTDDDVHIGSHEFLEQAKRAEIALESKPVSSREARAVPAVAMSTKREGTEVAPPHPGALRASSDDAGARPEPSRPSHGSTTDTPSEWTLKLALFLSIPVPIASVYWANANGLLDRLVPNWLGGLGLLLTS